MIQPIRGQAALIGFVAALAIGIPMAAQGATINMILSDLDVSYNGAAPGGSVYDIIAPPGGNLNPAESDEIETAVFEQNMTNVGTLMSTVGNRLSGDLRINGVGATVPLGTFQTGIGSNGGGFGFDWFTASGQKLRLG